ncbi:MAG: S8/S53 family peptidase, partial [Bacteroidota bacterium]
TGTQDAIDHGFASIAVSQINLQVLHNAGYLGAGVPVGVFDSGFISAQTNWAFAHVFANNRLIDAYDLQNKTPDVYDFDAHGTHVWSIMAADSSGFYVGTAPEADYALYRTEVDNSETRQELWNWVRAAERADSVGIWLINNSLGYNTFDNPDSNYVQADMDGNTTIVTRAADLAASRGMLVVTSSGNEGSAPWGTITAPCDGDSVLCVGAVNEFEECADFSGDGPTADGRIKPEVVALGQGAAYISTQEQLRYSNGTSLSAPVITGLAACLWQKYPSATNMMIYEAIRQSANRLNDPDSCFGYGVPNAEQADLLLKAFTSRADELNADTRLRFGPNPVRGERLAVWIQQPSVSTYSIRLYDLQGRLVQQLNDWPSGVKASLDISALSEGVYLLQATGERQLTARVLIQR